MAQVARIIVFAAPMTNARSTETALANDSVELEMHFSCSLAVQTIAMVIVELAFMLRLLLPKLLLLHSVYTHIQLHTRVYIIRT